MKKILYPSFVILLFAACEKDSDTLLPDGLNQVLTPRNANNVDVCHNGHIINISINAVPAHKAHGDAVDMDADGYMDIANTCRAGIDCIDSNDNVYPGAPEVCGNGMDDNCDGQVDEGCCPMSVQICDQEWMTKNLDVATYRNGDLIPEVTDPSAWIALTTGAWCYYDNDPANGLKYGKLYNWYAVNDPRGLAPDGWHVPSYLEWEALATCLGGSEVAGGKMKETGTTHWEGPNTDATNSSCFTGLPGGYREGGMYYLEWDGTFISGGKYGNWWSSSPWWTGTIAYRSYLSFDNGTFVDWTTYDELAGFSVRCLRD